VYDAEAHQTAFFAASNQGSTPDAVYRYDGEGRRVKKVSADETTIFVYDASGVLIAEYAGEVAAEPRVSYLTTDHLGSPRVVTDERGSVASRRDFTAFGEESFTAQRTQGLGYQPTEIRQNYTGYEKDEESGLEYAQARYYNATHGRFTSVDPLTASATIRNPQTLNRYSYALNSPYKFTDPLGLAPNGLWQGLYANNGSCSAAAEECVDQPDNHLQPVGAYGPSSHVGSVQLALQPDAHEQHHALGITDLGLGIPDGDLTIVFIGSWWTVLLSRPNNTVLVSQEAKALLDQATSKIASNIANAMGAVSALKENPTQSRTLTYSVGLDAGVEVSKTTVGGSVSGSLGGSVSATYSSVDNILSDLGGANDRIQLQLVDRLSRIISPVAGFDAPVALGTKAPFGIYDSAAASLGGVARKMGNQVAREHYIKTFPDRKDLWGLAYPSEFRKDR